MNASCHWYCIPTLAEHRAYPEPSWLCGFLSSAWPALDVLVVLGVPSCGQPALAKTCMVWKPFPMTILWLATIIIIYHLGEWYVSVSWLTASHALSLFELWGYIISIPILKQPRCQNKKVSSHEVFGQRLILERKVVLLLGAIAHKIIQSRATGLRNV